MWRFLGFLVLLAAITFGILYLANALPFLPREIAAETDHRFPREIRTNKVEKALPQAEAPDGNGSSLDNIRSVAWDHVLIQNAVIQPIQEQDVPCRLEEVGHVKEIFVQENQWVTRGTPLAQLDDRIIHSVELMTELKARSDSAIKAAEEKYKVTIRQVQDDRRAGPSVSENDKMIHEFQKDAAFWEHKKALEDRDIAQQELIKVKTQRDLYRVVSEVDGVVTRSLKKRGESVQRGEVMFKIANYNRVKIEGTVPEEQARLLRPGMRALVEPENRRGSKVLLGHKDTVTGLALTNDAQLLASCSKDGTVIVWKWSTGNQLAVLQDKANPVELYCIGVAGPFPTGPEKDPTYWFVTGVADEQLKLWQVATTRNSNKLTVTPVGFPKHHRGAIRSLDISPDGKYVVTGGDDNNICLWQIDGSDVKFLYKVRERDNEREPAHRGVVTTLKFAPDSRLISAATDKTIRQWKLGEERAELITQEGGRTGDVSTLGVSKDGNRVLFDFGEELRTYDLRTGTIVNSLQSHGYGPFNNLAIMAPAEDMILAYTSNGRLQLYATPAPSFFRQAAVEGFRRNTPMALGTLATSLAPFGDLASLASAATAQEQKHVTPEGRNALLEGSTEPGQLAIPHLWPVHGYELRHLVTPETLQVRCATFDPTGRALFTGGDDRTVRVWGLPDFEERREPLEAVITSIAESVETGTPIVRIRAEMDNPRGETKRRLMPGTRVNLSLFPEVSKQ